MMKPGVIIDVARSNQGCVETSRPTHSKPTYIVNGVYITA